MANKLVQEMFSIGRGICNITYTAYRSWQLQLRELPYAFCTPVQIGMIEGKKDIALCDLLQILRLQLELRLFQWQPLTNLHECAYGHWETILAKMCEGTHDT